MDPTQHRRFLDYRDMHSYFGRKTRPLGAAEFLALDEEHRTLVAKGDARDDEEEARFAEVAALLLRD